MTSQAASLPKAIRLPIAVLLVVPLVISATADLPRAVSLGPVSLLAGITIAYIVLAGVLILLKPILVINSIQQSLPFFLFLILGYLSFLWGKFTQAGAQNLIVWTAFLSLLLVTSVYSLEEKSRIVLGNGFTALAWVATLSYSFFAVLAWRGFPQLISPRTFVLVGLIGLSWYLARWRYESGRNMIYVLAMIAVMGASLSRIGFFAALVIFAVSRFKKENILGWFRVAFWLVVVLSILILAILYIQPLRERFFTGDMTLQFQGLTINATGRTAFWRTTYQSFLNSPWIGQGAGSAEEVITETFQGRITHPHNDYLRILHDYGIIGLILWLTSYIAFAWSSWRAWHRADRRKDPAAKYHLAAFLSLVGIAIAMVTDNTMVYIFDMAPLGILIGLSIGMEAADRRKLRPDIPVKSL